MSPSPCLAKVSRIGSGFSNSALRSKHDYKPDDTTRGSTESSVNVLGREREEPVVVGIGYFGELALKAGLQVDV